MSDWQTGVVEGQCRKGVRRKLGHCADEVAKVNCDLQTKESSGT